MQTTLAFAPDWEDLADIDLDAPILTTTPLPPDDEESEPGEP